VNAKWFITAVAVIVCSCIPVLTVLDCNRK